MAQLLGYHNHNVEQFLDLCISDLRVVKEFTDVVDWR